LIQLLISPAVFTAMSNVVQPLLQAGSIMP
jgi:hypothetical protein